METAAAQITAAESQVPRQPVLSLAELATVGQLGVLGKAQGPGALTLPVWMASEHPTILGVAHIGYWSQNTGKTGPSQPPLSARLRSSFTNFEGSFITSL